MVRAFFLIAMLSFASIQKAVADLGCASTQTGYLYTQFATQTGNTYEKYQVVQNPNTLYCYVSTGNDCRIRSNTACSGCSHIGSWYYQDGDEYSFTYVDCPVDKYLIILLPALAAVGFYKIKANTLRPNS